MCVGRLPFQEAVSFCDVDGNGWMAKDCPDSTAVAAYVLTIDESAAENRKPHICRRVRANEVKTAFQKNLCHGL
jgi:hypothetical protein